MEGKWRGLTISPRASNSKLESGDERDEKGHFPAREKKDGKKDARASSTLPDWKKRDREGGRKKEKKGKQPL